MTLIVLGTLGLILIVGTLIISVNDFVQDKISFYQIKNIVKNSEINELRGNEHLFSLKTKTFELTQLNSVGTNAGEYYLGRYHGAVLKIKNLTSKTCTIEKSFFDQFIGYSDFIEIRDQILQPSKETLIFFAYKNLDFRGYHTKSTRHTSLLTLNKNSSLPDEYFKYDTIHNLLSTYRSLMWKISSERIESLEKESSKSIYANYDFQYAFRLKEEVDQRKFLSEIIFQNYYCKNDTSGKLEKLKKS
jgi:hypothetical protein